MPQLLESSLLGALAVGSAVSLTISTINHRGVKLLGVVQDAGSSDPLDVAQPEDVVDGEPIDEAMFWKRMRLRKMLLTLVLLATLALEVARPPDSADTRGAAATTACVVRIAFASYALLLAASSVGRRDTRHWTLVVHISCATAAASLLLAASAAVPSRDSRLSTYARCAPAAAYLLSCAVAITIPRGPPLHYPSERIYSHETLTAATSGREDNVCGSVSASVLDTLLFSYATKVVTLGTTTGDFETGDLPLVPARMRAVYLFAAVRAAADARGPRLEFWRAAPGSGWGLAYRVVRANAGTLAAVVALAAAAAGLFYAPSFFLQRVVRYVEGDPARTGAQRGLLFSAGLFVSNAAWQLVTGQLWSIATTTLQVRMRVQLNSLLFAKTLVRKDVASTLGADGEADAAGDEEEFSSKAQVMNLMTTDADRVSRFSSHLYALVDAPIEVAIGTFFLYKLLGVSCFYGLALTFIFLPLNHFAGSLMVGTEEKLMKARDERVGLMNEILGGIRMLKFMAWERSFEARVMKIRKWELQNQHRVYIIETLWSCMWNGSPIIITLVSLWHFSVYREQVLTPSIAFTAISVFQKMKSALNVLPETFINMLQCFVSLRRIEKYLHAAEITHVRPLARQVDQQIILQSATIAWPKNGNKEHGSLSTASTPRHKFILSDLSLEFPRGELSLVCGKLGSGKTLLLLALLGEADLLTGRLVCPRSPPDALATFANQHPSEEEWIVPGVCAYVPQVAWLRNTSIRDNILFELPFHEGRYQKTLEACALLSDLEILPDGDMSEIGERGVTLSGGQKARVSLARAVYSRASVLLLDDVLSAVDAHTAHHIFHTCLRGGLTRGRTVILVSHHVQLCAPEASYVVSLDNGRLAFAGPRTEFQASDVLGDLWRSGAAEPAADDGGDIAVPDVEELMEEAGPSTVGDKAASPGSVAKKPEERPAPKKLVEEEKRAVGHVGGDVWSAYLGSYGGWVYWAVYGVCFGFAAVVPVWENGWLKIWSGSSLETGSPARTPVFYMSGYAIITLGGLFLSLGRWFVLYHGGMRSSSVLYHRLLESVLFATLRFHDTVSRGRLLNRFGKDFESVDSTLPDFIGRTTFLSLNVIVTYSVMTIIGGPPFLLAAVILAYLYYSVGRVYGQTSRDLRRLDSVTRSPLYSMYGETIAGVPVVRAFGASSKFMRDMLRCVDTNTTPYYWLWSVSRWVSVRFNLLSSAAVGVVAVTVVSNASISASTAGFALAFATSLTDDLLSLVQQFVGLEQAMVAVERIKEFTDLEHEPSEYIEPRPPAAWPTEGAIKCEDLAVRYAPDLPDVLKDLNFVIQPGEKVGVLGRTGSGKSTLALSFFRFVEPTNGRILVDGVDISHIGLADLRSRLTIIPQDPTILSGTLRTTLDVFGEYEDAEIYEALRRVHLIPTGDNSEDADTLNANVFQNLDSPVSEGGDNLSTGEKQLLCMARAILKRTRVLLMDEATASVDYATDELIGKTIRQEFAGSTILTIAHRLRTIIDYDRVMLLDQGRIVEFDRPAALLANPDSMFYALCKATGKSEFAVLRKMAGIT